MESSSQSSSSSVARGTRRGPSDRRRKLTDCIIMKEVQSFLSERYRNCFLSRKPSRKGFRPLLSCTISAAVVIQITKFIIYQIYQNLHFYFLSTSSIIVHLFSVQVCKGHTWKSSVLTVNDELFPLSLELK